MGPVRVASLGEPCLANSSLLYKPEANHNLSTNPGYANAVRKAVGSETTPMPPVSDGSAPIDTAALKSGGGKGASKATNKAGNTPSAAVAPAKSVSVVHLLTPCFRITC